jgi:hypothetical protein
MNTTTGIMTTEQILAKTESELAVAKANLAAATDERLIEVYRDHVATKLERLAWIYKILARDARENIERGFMVDREDSNAQQPTTQVPTATQEGAPNGQA